MKHVDYVYWHSSYVKVRLYMQLQNHVITEQGQTDL